MSPVTPAPVAQPYTFRPMRRADVPDLFRLRQVLAAEEPDSNALTLADVLERDFGDPWADPATDWRLGLAADGTVVARACLSANPEPEAEVVATLSFDIHPAHRTDALQAPLLDWLTARAAERVRAIAADNPGRQPLVLRLFCWDGRRDLCARLQRHGFQPVRYHDRLRRDLRAPIPDRPLPAGLVLRPYHPELDEPIRLARNETFRDGWDFKPLSPAEWQVSVIRRSSFRPDLSFAILAGDEVVAFSLNRFEPDKAGRSDFDAGWIGMLGTRRAWRQRGLASALVVHSLRAFQAAGLGCAGLGVDAENPTGALRLYEHLGFALLMSHIVLDKLVEASASPKH